MEVIQAKVNERLLSKADRLFTGGLDGRIIEILQNARRAGATEVHIVNSDGQVTVHDNGRGIAEFSGLLDLGRSNWDGDLENAEDPAGVGVFCLAPRRVCITSGGQKVVIAGKGWTGELVEVQATELPVEGTRLIFEDTAWLFEMVEPHAVFSGLRVTVDGKECSSKPFVSRQAVTHPQLGCRIEVRERNALGEWHNSWKRSYYTDNVLVNFHGQVVTFTYTPLSEHLQFLVDMTGEATGIRLMLPARTRLVENETFEWLKAAIEQQAYRYIQGRGSHKLKFSEYCRAKDLGIQLPEAEPIFQVGLLTEEPVEPVTVTKPEDFPLRECYRLNAKCQDADGYNEANVHLLSALGKFDHPFVVVDISSDYDGYSWADLLTVERIEVKAGEELHKDHVWCETLAAVRNLQVIAYTSDGRVFSSAVPMAVRKLIEPEGKRLWSTTEVVITQEAREELESTDIWYHLGGWSEDGDTYQTQLTDFEEQLNLFWADVIGPGEFLRQRLCDCLRAFRIDWESISIHSSGKVWISHKDGTAEMLQPPELATES